MNTVISQRMTTGVGISSKPESNNDSEHKTMKTTDPKIWKIQKNTAADLKRRLATILTNLGKAPSYAGKAALMDKVIRAQGLAHNLEFSLAHDCEPK
jgi:hypothetical protein